MILVSLNLVLILVIYQCDATSIAEDVKSYFQSGTKEIRDMWSKYKRGIETSLEQMLQDNYDAKSMNVYLRRAMDSFRLAEGFLEDSDPVVEVLFRDLHLMELPKMRDPKVSFSLASNMLKLDTELMRVKVFGKYMVYRNDSVIVYTNKKEDMLKVSPFSLEQVDSTGEVAIIGDECHLTGHAMATLTDQSVNLGHNTFNVINCKFSLEIWSPGKGMPPVFAPYFGYCDGGYLQNLISEALEPDLMSKLQGGVFSFVNASDIFGDRLPEIRAFQDNLFKKVNNHLTETVNNMNTITTNLNQGVVNIDPKVLDWRESDDGGTMKNFISIKNMTLYGLDTAYSYQNGGPEFFNGTVYVEDRIGFSTLQVRGIIQYSITKKSSAKLTPTAFKFSAELQDLSVVISLTADKDLVAPDFPSKTGRPGWFAPRLRNFELNHYDIDSIWSRSLLTAYIVNEVHTAMVKSILNGPMNDALKLTSQGNSGKIQISPQDEKNNYVKPKKDKDSKDVFKLKKGVKSKLNAALPTQANLEGQGDDYGPTEEEKNDDDDDNDYNDKNDNEINSE